MKELFQPLVSNSTALLREILERSPRLAVMSPSALGEEDDGVPSCITSRCLKTQPPAFGETVYLAVLVDNLHCNPSALTQSLDGTLMLESVKANKLTLVW